jgi:hypothetical protein
MRVAVKRVRWLAFGATVVLCGSLVGCGSTERQGVALPNGGSTSSAGGGAGAGAASVGGAPLPFEAVASTMHRLSGNEYQATVLDMLNSAVQTNVGANDGSYNGYDNNAEVLSVSPEMFQLYLQAAETVADDVFTSDARKAAIVTCQAQDDDTCVRSIISGLGLRLFRRPLLDAELAAYQKLYATARTQGSLHEAALEQVLVAALSSAQFLYRIEFAPAADGPQQVGPYDLASRLSYLLWSSAPDEALLSAAAANQLARDSELSEQLARMWQDAKARRFSQNFGGQWLRTRSLPAHQADRMTFPDWTPEAAQAAADEASLFFEQLIREDRPALDLVTGYPHQVPAALASFYGLTAPAPGEPLTLTTGDRNGFLGSVAFLTQTSNAARTDPIRRAQSILSNLLCSPVPPEPPDLTWNLMVDLPPSATARQYLETFQSDLKCVPCHAVLDPLGLALEHYDAVGHYRDTYNSGIAVDSSAHLAPWTAHPAGLDITGLPGVVERVKTDPAFEPCVAQNLYMYGMGRMLGDDGSPDQRNVKALARLWQEGPTTLKELVQKLVLSQTFRYRDDRNDGGRP